MKINENKMKLPSLFNFEKTPKAYLYVIGVENFLANVKIH